MLIRNSIFSAKLVPVDILLAPEGPPFDLIPFCDPAWLDYFCCSPEFSWIDEIHIQINVNSICIGKSLVEKTRKLSISVLFSFLWTFIDKHCKRSSIYFVELDRVYGFTAIDYFPPEYFDFSNPSGKFTTASSQRKKWVRRATPQGKSVGKFYFISLRKTSQISPWDVNQGDISLIMVVSVASSES